MGTTKPINVRFGNTVNNTEVLLSWKMKIPVQEESSNAIHLTYPQKGTETKNIPIIPNLTIIFTNYKKDKKIWTHLYIYGCHLEKRINILKIWLYFSIYLYLKNI